MTKSKKELTSKVVQLVKDNFESFNDQQKALQIIRIALLDYEPQAQIEALKQVGEKIMAKRLSSDELMKDDELHWVLYLVDQQIKEIEKR